ncbi:MAG TPA: FAD-dependent oxidoreductase [Spirochaetales bacterium]|nr:FAD-dependent oxidoreductase [Spirochaetales bacterium]HPG85138.1 FAD-dependent oxidoreductase [Spirochaetales bacterium]
MMKMRRTYRTLVAAIAILVSVLAGCNSVGRGGSVYAPGTYSVSTKGFGGDVTVALTVDARSIVGVEIVGEDETPEIGGMAMERMARDIPAVGEAVEGVSGATYTSDAVKRALSEALARARGESVSVKLDVAPGSYGASAPGFDLSVPVPVTVGVVDGRIASIEIGACKETEGKLTAVRDRLIPRIIERQSLAVDAVTGATATSNAVIGAVRASLVAAGASEAALYAPVPRSSAKEAYTADVVVVGFGASGMTASLAAAEKGAKVIALEKSGRIGGTAVVTSGPMAVNAPSMVGNRIVDWDDPLLKKKRVKEAGEPLVDAGALLRDWLQYTTVDGVQGAKEGIIRRVVDRSGQTLDWLTGFGFEFSDARGFLGNQWALFSPFKGNKALTESFFDKAVARFEKEFGGRCLVETEATSLIIEGGRIAGVRARKSDGTEVTVKAKAVILASGGFGGSDEMMEQYLGESWKMYGMEQNEGDGIRMALSAGAATYNIGMPPMSHFSAPSVILRSFDSDFDNDIPFGMVATSETLAVNKSGVRFINEANIGLDAYLGGSRFYTIYSKEQIDVLRARGFGFAATGRYLNRGGIKADAPLVNIDAVIDAGVEAGFVYKAKSLSALAAAIAADNGVMKAANLERAVAEYGAGIATGKDVLGKPLDRARRLGPVPATSEYYVAVTGAPYIYSTCGGLDVNEDMGVLRGDGSVIEGLYAVGNDSMGVLFTDRKGYANYGGVAEGYAFVSGRIAGEAAAHK